MERILERLSRFFYKHVGFVRWWFNLTLATKLILAFSINAFITLFFGGIVYYLVKSGTDLRQNVGILLTLTIIASVIIVMYGLYIAYLTSTPLRRSVNFAETIAGGDLTPTLYCMTQKDETGILCQALNTMVENFRSLVGNIIHGADIFADSTHLLAEQAETTALAAQQVAAAIEQVAEGSQSQANNVQNIFNIVQQMTTEITQIEQSLGMATKASGQALNLAGEGNQSIQRVNTQMEHIHQTVDETGGIISELGEKSSSISSIVETIKDIAGKTNLLALNAAIEAARAGEHGRGFSVVADEVRKLAEQSTNSSAQIEKIIQDIKLNVDRAIASMNSEKEVVLTGTHVIQDAQEAFHRITESTQIVNEQIQEVSSLAIKMSHNSEEISNEVASVAAISQQTTAQTEEVASSSTEQMNSMQEINFSTAELSSEASELQTTARRFKLA